MVHVFECTRQVGCAWLCERKRLARRIISPSELGARDSKTHDQSRGQGLFGTADGVPDWGPYADNVVGAEVGSVVYDVVEVRLGPHKDISVYVVADAAANIHQEMVAAGVAGTEIDAVAGRLVTIEASGLPADAAHEVGADLLAQAGLVHAVEVKQDGAEGYAKSRVISSARFPGSLKIEADVFVKDDVSADTWVQASLFGYHTTTYTARGRPRRQDRTEAEHGVSLLRVGEGAEQEKRTEWCEYG